MKSLVEKTGTLTVAAVLVVLMAAPLSASGAEVTKGTFESFAAGSGQKTSHPGQRVWFLPSLW